MGGCVEYYLRQRRAGNGVRTLCCWSTAGLRRLFSEIRVHGCIRSIAKPKTYGPDYVYKYVLSRPSLIAPLCLVLADYITRLRQYFCFAAPLKLVRSNNQILQCLSMYPLEQTRNQRLTRKHASCEKEAKLSVPPA